MTAVVTVLAGLLAWWQLELDPQSVLVVAAVAGVAFSAWASVFWPFTPCPAPLCDKGKIRRPGKRKTYRKCGWCGGKGERVRWLRRLYDEVRPSKHRRR